MMNRSQRAHVAGRDRGYRRVGQLTRWTATGSGVALAVIGVVLAQGPASASASTTAPPATGGGAVQPGAVSQPAPQVPAPGSSSQGSSSQGLSAQGRSSQGRSSQGRSSQGYGLSGSQGLQPPVVVPQYSYGSGSSVLSGGS